MSESYSLGARAWRNGPARVYDRMAEATLAPLGSLAHKRALDLGAGTGAATQVLERAGARVVATDMAVGMLRTDFTRRPPCAVADARALPFRDDTFDVVAAAFVFNHLVHPAVALREAVRVTRPGGSVVVSAYAHDDDHPAKAAVMTAARAAGWTPASWTNRLRTDAMPNLATVHDATAHVLAAGLNALVEKMEVALPDLDIDALIDWRVGMADIAPFVSTLSADATLELRTQARSLLGDSVPTLVRKIIVITITA